MDTEDKYLDTEFYVQMVGEAPPDFAVDYYERRINDPDDSLVDYQRELRDHHQLDKNVPIDGIVAFYWPDQLEKEDGTPWSFSFPFRDNRKDDEPWFAFPDKDSPKRHPVWKWQNPEESTDNITLDPSLGVGQPPTFHCYIRNGEIQWL